MSSEVSSSPKLPPFLSSLLSPSQYEQLTQYAELLRQYNQRLNLISRQDIEKVWEHHIVPSLLFLGWWRLPTEGIVLDLGTGGGLPGIPLAIAHPQTRFLLIDSTRKKVEAVAAMLATLGLLGRCEVRWIRAETLSERFLTIVGRAVAPLPTFLKWAKKLLAPEGVVYYYTGEPWGPLPPSWEGEFFPFRRLLPEEPYLATKGILRLRANSLGWQD
jgi:16S rRNA (guanine527-N7)-methyltransferase